MDPYLENPAGWPDVHHGLITSISDALIRRIAPRYYVTIDPRVYSVAAGDSGSILLDPEIREARPGEPERRMPCPPVPFGTIELFFKRHL